MLKISFAPLPPEGLRSDSFTFSLALFLFSTYHFFKAPYSFLCYNNAFQQVLSQQELRLAGPIPCLCSLNPKFSRSLTFLLAAKVMSRVWEGLLCWLFQLWGHSSQTWPLHPWFLPQRGYGIDVVGLGLFKRLTALDLSRIPEKGSAWDILVPL